MNILKFLRPINLEEEQEKFFNSHEYNPVFSYDWDSQAIDSWLSNPRQKKYAPFVSAVLKQNTADIILQGKKIFSSDIDTNTLEIAQQIVERSRQKIKDQSIQDLVAEFERVLDLFNISYTVQLSEERGFAVKPSHSNKTLTINKHLDLTYDSYEGIVRHELLHVIRSINGVYNGIEKSDFYLPTEEGLASYVQNYKGAEENYSLYQHALRYLATDVAVNGSFRDVVEYLQELGIEKNLAFRRAVRHKGGLVNTAETGDSMKSSMYFYNLQKIRKLSDLEILRLLVGKIATQELSNYPQYKGEIDSSHIISYFDLEI